MKSYTLSIRLIVLISCSSCVLIKHPAVSSDQCIFSKYKISMKRFIDDSLTKRFSRCNILDGSWTRVANLDMSNTSQLCPTVWKPVNTTVRACGRQESSSASCNSVIFSTNGMEYSQVCGRIIGYQYGSPQAFHPSLFNDLGIDSWYIDGVSLTHGTPGSRTHVWSFVNAWTELAGYRAVCTCMRSGWPYAVPDFVGNNYFCATGNDKLPYLYSVILSHNPLWDGEGCTGSNTCCQFNRPPWFYSTLPEATTDDLEVRICASSRSSSTNIFISHIELYVK